MATSLNDIQQSILILAQGGVILHPTETCYGFACDAMNEKAILKLYQLKKMPLDKPSSIMVANFEEAKKYGDFSELAENLARDFWPGPLTLIVPRAVSRKNLPDFLNPGISTVGIRVPDHFWIMELLRAYPTPLITTSANVSGQTEVYEISEVLRQLEAELNSERPDFVVDIGLIPRQKPSTILKILGDSFRILRKGSLQGAVLERYSEFFVSE